MNVFGGGGQCIHYACAHCKCATHLSRISKTLDTVSAIYPAQLLVSYWTDLLSDPMVFPYLLLAQGEQNIAYLYGWTLAHCIMDSIVNELAYKRKTDLQSQLESSMTGLLGKLIFLLPSDWHRCLCRFQLLFLKLI